MTQVVQIPLQEWRSITRILTRLDKAEAAKPKAEWITTGQLSERTGKSKEQIRRMRLKTHPEIFKPKPNSTQYLCNWSEYTKIYAA